jgi:urease accessory protein UreE
MANLKSDLERVRYWQGQLLTAGDLREQLATDVELRRLHDRSGHRAVGIAIGLQVTPDDGAPAVRVAEGLAYDCASRALVLTQARTVALPGPADVAHILMIHADSNAPTGVELRWRRARDWDPREGVALALLAPPAVGSGTTAPELDPDFRTMVARPLARAHTAQGQTIPGQTSWQPWILGGSEVGVQVKVDTSAAGFTVTPHYFASAIAGRIDDTLTPAWFESIGDPGETEFSLRLLLRGIAAQALSIADPRPKVTSARRLEAVGLSGGDPLVIEDAVARLLPVMQRVARVEAISSANIVTLNGPQPVPAQGRVGVCMLPRTATVETTSQANANVLIDVDITPSTLVVDDVVLRMEDRRAAGLARVVGVFGLSLLELDHAIAGLDFRDTLGVVEPGSEVTKVADLVVTVKDARPFEMNRVAIALQPTLRDSLVFDIVTVNTNDNTLTLASAIAGLEGKLLSTVKRTAATVMAGQPEPPRLRVNLSQHDAFRVGDLLTKGGRVLNSERAPVAVERKNEDALVLRGSRADLSEIAQRDRLSAATLGVRATVRSVFQQGEATVVFVDQPERFRGRFVARVSEQWALEGPRWVTEVTATSLTLSASSIPLGNGDVIGVCDFPRSVTVVSGAEGRTILVSAPDVLVPGDVVNGAPDREGVSIVESTDGTEVRLTTPIAKLEDGDILHVANLGQVITVETSGSDLKLVDAPLLRVGDALGTIITWRQSAIDTALVAVTAVEPQIALSAWPDGLLSGDVLGLASLQFPVASLRLTELPELQNQDEVSLLGIDATFRQEFPATGTVQAIASQQKRILLSVASSNGTIGREFRPDDIAATVQFLRGSALKLIRNQDLFVSWFALDDPLLMPRTWATPELSDCRCAPAKEP